MKRGFTLIEVLIALSIFSIMAVMCTSVLFTVFSSKDKTTEHADRLNDIQVAMVLIEQDITQIVVQPLALQQTQLEFSRGGMINPSTSKALSSLARVKYTLTDNQLERRSNALNQQMNKPSKITQSSVVLHHVDKFKLSYIDKHLQVHDLWRSNKLPYGIRITLTLKDFGEVSELFLLPQSAHLIKQFKSSSREDSRDDT